MRRISSRTDLACGMIPFDQRKLLIITYCILIHSMCRMKHDDKRKDACAKCILAKPSIPAPGRTGFLVYDPSRLRAKIVATVLCLFTSGFVAFGGFGFGMVRSISTFIYQSVS